MSFLIVLIIAFSLSLDAFSLSLSYGTLGFKFKDMIFLSLIVGIFHFFMPILGFFLGNIVISSFSFNVDFFITVIFCFIGIQMIIESFKNDTNIRNLNFLDYFLFGFAVSIDSFSIGITLNEIYDNYFICCLTFSIFSFLFTFLGLFLGKKISNIFGKLSIFIGGVILIVIGLFYL